MRKLRLIKIFFIIILFFIMSFDLCNAQYANCGAAGGECLSSPNLNQYELLTNVAAGACSTGSSCYKKYPQCSSPNSCSSTGTCLSGKVLAYCDGGAITVCCKAVEDLQQIGVNSTESKLDETPEKSKPISFTPEIGIPGFSGKMEVGGFLFGSFLKALFVYLIYLSGIIAVIIFIIAGFQWVLAGGNQSKIGDAKKRIVNSIIGMVLCVSSVLILRTINSDLINIVPLNIIYIKPIDFDLEDDLYADSSNYTPNANVGGSCSGSVVQVPFDGSVMFYGLNGVNFKATQNNRDMFLRAVECMKRRGGGNIKISINSVYRPGDSGTHGSGYSFDLQASPFTKTNQFMLQDCMYEQGFWNFGGECWHFTCYKASGLYSRTHNTSCCPHIGGVKNKWCK